MSLKLNPDKLYFIPLGGSEEFGCNFNLYGTKGKWLIMDCGMGFADHRMPLVDIVLPKPDFIEQFKNDIVGLVITHAHEDHIGAAPYLWPRLQCPVFCTPFTAEVMRRKLRDFPQSKKMPVTEIGPEKPLDLGPFHLEFVGITHSVPENVSTAIHTDSGIVLHTGDWNLDPNPQLGKATNQKEFKEIGKKGVLAYIGDSTNAQVPGRTPSEQEVEDGLTLVFSEQEKMICVTTFSSNIGRIISIARAAEKAGRSVGVIGRSLHNMIGAARECGFLNDIPDFVDEGNFDRIARDNIVLIVTGSQGEARAALSRISRGEFSGVKLQKGDTVVFSSRDIPGNEKDINAVKNALTASGIKVLTEKSAGHRIHVSGHPCQGELKDMMAWARPKIAVPVHGERMMTQAHAALAKECGVPHVIVPNNGSVIELDPENPRIIDHVETGFLGVEPQRLMDSDSQAITARRKLQYTGVVFITVPMDGQGNVNEGLIEISSLGVEDKESENESKLYDDIREEIMGTVDDVDSHDIENNHIVSEEIRIVVRRMLTHRYGFKPNVVVHLMRV